MIKELLKTIMLTQAASAARKTLLFLSRRDVDDVGRSRSAFVDGLVESVRTDIEARVADEPMSKIIKSVIKPNLNSAI